MRGYLHLVLFIVSRNNLFHSPRHGLSSLSESKNRNNGFERCDRHIHVGNLNWNVPAADISKQLLKNTKDCISVYVKSVDPDRARDSGKCHGGSAVLEFASQQHASEALRALQAFSIANDCNYRLKYAVQCISEPEQEPLTAKVLERRKERAASYARRRVRVAERTDRILERLHSNNDSILQDQVPILHSDTLDWSKCPVELDPMHGGGLKEGSQRAERKRASVEAFVSVLQAVLKPHDNDNGAETLQIADLGSGSGNLALPLQWWLLNNDETSSGRFDIVAVDYNAKSLERLTDRSKSTNIPVKTIKQDLRHLISSSHKDCKYAAVVSLHACGAASDMAMAVGVSQNIPFGISPCCIGKVNKWYSPSHQQTSRGMLSPLDEFSYPRSQWLRQVITNDEYQLLANSADYGVIYDNEADEHEMNRRKRCRMAKQVVEADRLEWAQEHGYEVRMVELPRIGPFYPKRELLLGAPKGSYSAERIKGLPCLNRDP